MTKEDPIETIRSSLEKEGLLLTLHAADEMIEEDISAEEVNQAILNGTIIEDYPRHRRGSCCLVYGKTDLGRDLHTVVTSGKAPVRLITVYEPQPPYWTNPTQRGTGR